MVATRIRPTPKDKRKRRRRRIVTLAIYVVLVFALAWVAEQQATTTVLFVRHADTDSAAFAGADPALNERGLARANLLADFLEQVDVVGGVDAIYASEFRRTQQTAAPLAARLGLEVEIADPYDVVGFMADVMREHKGEIVLVVTHGDAIAPLVDELHGSKNIAAFEGDDYDRLIVVTSPWFGKVKTLQLPYALGWEPPHYPGPD